MTAPATEQAAPRVLRRAEVEQLTGLGTTSLYTLEGFPRPVNVTPRAVRWVESEVVAWMAARMAERDQGARP